MRFRSIALLCLCALMVGAAPAQASHVTCGEVITADTTLDEDLSCPGVGVRFGADDISLDLGGHTLGSEFIAVVASDRRNLEIRNGTLDLARSATGVDLLRVNGAAVQDLLITGEADASIHTAFYVDEAGDILVHRNTVRARSTFGLISANSTRLRVTENAVEDATHGFSLDETSDSTVDRNTVSALRGIELGPRSDANDVRSNSIAALFGIDVSGSTANAITGNTVDALFGISIDDDAPANSVRANTLRGDPLSGSVGITVNSDRNRVEGNQLSGYAGLGIRLFKAGQNSIARNQVTASGVGIGLVTTSFGGVVAGGSHGNAVVRNEVSGNAEDGIAVGSLDDGNLVERNAADRNGDDGIDIDAPSVEVTRNSAFDNGDLGIEAVPGTIDGGRNRAAGNGNPAQ
jgi:large repetitive protein